jgi:MoaA/NifB/PqqE/SkfB family radical SAM enzyme
MLKTMSEGLWRIGKTRVGRSLNLQSYPKFISASVTWRCDSRCSTCGIWRAPLDKIDETPVDVYMDNVLRDPITKQLQTFEMTGGEPMLYDGIFALTEMAFKYLPKKAQVRIGTNCIKKDRLNEYIFVNQKNPLYLSLSIDGIWEMHDEIRGVEGNFEAVMEVIDFIRFLQDEKDSPVSFGASVTVSRLNLEYIPTLTEWLKSKNVPYQLTPVIFPEYAQNEHARRSKEELDFVSDADRARIIEVFSEQDRLTYPIFCKYWAGEEYPIPPCYAMREYIHLRPNGTAESCMWLHHDIGNIRENTLSEIWESQRAKELRTIVRDCTACNRAHPNLCDSLNNYHFHGTLLLNSWRRRLGFG